MKKIIFLVFILAILVRLLYFPENVYFAYDQARDSYTALEILKGNLKFIGPPSFASDKLFAGPLVYYVYALPLALFDKNPEAISVLLRVINSLGVIGVFLIGTSIFNKRAGLLAAILFAFSYEQSQYALFISHQPQAVIPMLLFYLGLSLLIFKNEPKGIVLAMFGWGLSMQFHYGYILMVGVLFALALVFARSMLLLRSRYFILSLFALLGTISTYIAVEVKHGFLSSFFSQPMGIKPTLYFSKTIFIIYRFFHDLLLANYSYTPLIAIITIGIFIFLFFQKQLRLKLIFLLIWFLGGLAPYLLSGVPSYYYSAATSVSLLIFISYVVSELLSWRAVVGFVIIFGIVANNLYLITTINPQGVNRDMVIQPGMLVSDQKRILDYIYSNALDRPFSVNALTVPLNVNTTWSYLFEWYGKSKYHYIPTWGGDAAAGFPGALPIVKDRAKLPTLQFMIIEPTVGIREAYQINFFKEESYFSKVVDEKKFGTIIVQKRQKI